MRKGRPSRLILGKRDKEIRERMLACLEKDKKIRPPVQNQFVRALMDDLDLLTVDESTRFKAYLLAHRKDFDGYILKRMLLILNETTVLERPAVGELALQQM